MCDTNFGCRSRDSWIAYLATVWETACLRRTENRRRGVTAAGVRKYRDTEARAKRTQVLIKGRAITTWSGVQATTKAEPRTKLERNEDTCGTRYDEDAEMPADAGSGTRGQWNSTQSRSRSERMPTRASRCDIEEDVDVTVAIAKKDAEMQAAVSGVQRDARFQGSDGHRDQVEPRVPKIEKWTPSPKKFTNSQNSWLGCLRRHHGKNRLQQY